MLISNEGKLSEFSENDEILHVTKTQPKPKVLDNIIAHAKTRGLEMNFETKRRWGELKGEVTHQYLKFVNAHLQERLKHINKMKKMKNELENEIEELQTSDLTNLIIFPDVSIDELNENELSELSEYMKLQKNIAKSKIDYYKNKMDIANNDLQEKEWQIQELDKKQSNEVEIESEQIVKEELNFLIKKYGIKELTYAIDVITSTKRKF